MKTLWGLMIVLGLCLVVFTLDASARGFGGFRGGGGDRGVWSGGDAAQTARRANWADSGFFAGGWGMDESDDDDDDNEYDDNDDD